MVRDDINKHAKEEDKEILLWLLAKYHWSSEWSFVAQCSFKRYGEQSFKMHRVWSPTTEGRLIYKHRGELPNE